jgi:hypothetical protein
MPQWDDGEGLNLQDRLKCAFYEATHWPTTASCSLPADAPEPQLLPRPLRLEESRRL